jgi:hypothetical protein
MLCAEDSMQRSGLTREQVAREVNGEIASLAERLQTAREGALGFFCECGCWSTVAIGVDEYRAGGAWLPGHKAATEAAEPLLADPAPSASGQP